MKKYINIFMRVYCLVLPFCVFALFVANAAQQRKYNQNVQQVKEDVKKLMDDIEEYGDIDTYMGSDHFERLYNWTHNTNK